MVAWGGGGCVYFLWCLCRAALRRTSRRRRVSRVARRASLMAAGVAGVGGAGVVVCAVLAFGFGAAGARVVMFEMGVWGYWHRVGECVREGAFDFARARARVCLCIADARVIVRSCVLCFCFCYVLYILWFWRVFGFWMMVRGLGVGFQVFCVRVDVQERARAVAGVCE